MILPIFLIIGAQRSGTTWLYRMLRQHPEIYLPEKKELEFFSFISTIREMSMEGYSKNYFSEYSGQKAIGKATPSYLWNSNEYPQFIKDKRHTLKPQLRALIPLRERDDTNNEFDFRFEECGPTEMGSRGSISGIVLCQN